MMLNLIQTIITILVLVFIPILLIYSIFKSTLDVFKGARAVAKLTPLLLVAETANPFEQALRNIASFYDTLISAFITLFFILLPTIIFLLLWKSFIKLIKL